jgi:hypothetical protein
LEFGEGCAYPLRNAGSVFAVLDEDMALKPPIHWNIFFPVDIAGLVPLTNLLDGLRWGVGVIPCSFDIFSLRSICWETVFLG